MINLFVLLYKVCSGFLLYQVEKNAIKSLNIRKKFALNLKKIKLTSYIDDNFFLLSAKLENFIKENFLFHLILVFFLSYIIFLLSAENGVL